MIPSNTQSTPVPDPSAPETTWSVRGFIQFLNTVVNMVLDLFDVIIEPFFKINETGRFVRSMLFVLGFIVWLIAAYTAHFPDFASIKPWFTVPPSDNLSAELMLATLMLFQQIIQIIFAIIAPFFAPDIFRHVLVIGLAAWIAYQWAGIYLDDIFELKDTKISRKFIRGAAFIGPLEKVEIADGEIKPKYKDSPVVRIGGPGKVVVHLENAALFEKINGEAQIILSEDKDKQILLDGFERLRTVRNVPPKQAEGHAIFDRRDQFIGSQTTSGRTKDGIVVTAKNISAVFSLHQGPVEVMETTLPAGSNGKVVVPQISRRISFDREALETAIKNLVYNQVNRPWTETAKQNIFPSIRIWISQHTLDEFLTNLSPQELAEFRERMYVTGQEQIPLQVAGNVYRSRAEITNFVQGSPDSWRTRGYDVYWVGVGTWETPDEIPKQHKEALELSVKNRLEGSEMELSRLQRESRLDELIRLFQDVPINTFQEALRAIHRKSTGVGLMQFLGSERVTESYAKLLIPPEDARVVKYKLLVAYREKFKNARDWYARNQQQPPEELQRAIEHLSRFTPPTPKNSDG